METQPFQPDSWIHSATFPDFTARSGHGIPARMQLPPISAIIFDCDGVLIDSEVLALEIEIAVLAEAGLHYEREEFARRFAGMSMPKFYAELEADGLARLGRSIRDVIYGPMQERYREAFDTRLTEITGALAAIAAVTHLKAVASSSPRDTLEKKLRKVGHWNYFDPHIYSADHVKDAKPAPDLFLLAAKELGIAPHACLVIEDSVNGVTAAKAAGMRCWGFTGGGHMSKEAGLRLLETGAERLVSGWSEFAKELAKL
jgi:HAD superfamily hydrolase (TIGR01509 family)